MAERSPRSILNNLVSMTTAEILTRLASYFYLIHLSYALGVEGVGLIATALTFSEIFVSLISNGLDVYAISEISKDKERPSAVVSPILALKLLLGIGSYMMLAAVVTLTERPPIEAYAILIAGLHIFGRGVSGKWIYQGLERMNVIAIRQVISSVLLVVGVYMLVSGSEDLLIAIWVQVAVELINTLWTFVYYLREGYKINLMVGWGKLKQLFRAALPYGAFFLLISLYNTIDKNMIWILREDFEYLNGILHSALKISALFLVPTMIIQNVYFPRFSISKDKEIKKLYHTEYVRLMSVFMSVGFGVMFFFPEINSLIFPENFSEVGSLLPFYAVVSSIIYGVLFFTVPLMAWGYQKQLLMATGAGVLGNITVNLLLIPSMGMYGALIATIIAECSVLVVSYLIFRRERIPFPIRYPATALIISTLVFGAWHYLGLSDINLIFALLIVITVHLLLLWALRVVDMELIKKLSAD